MFLCIEVFRLGCSGKNESQAIYFVLKRFPECMIADNNTRKMKV
jgi:hypothetical protein